MGSSPDPGRGAAARLNAACACATLGAAQLHGALEAASPIAGLAAQTIATRPHLFSAAPVFVSRAEHDTLAALVAAIERVVSQPAYQRLALARAPAIAQRDFGPHGGALGYDFHLGAQGPQLIEINTNPGGALLNLALARAQRLCAGTDCGDFLRAAHAPAAVEAGLLAVFREEWRRQRGAAPLRHLVIADDDPQQQYLYPEFELYAQLFARAGLRARIADARRLEWRAGRLWLEREPVDLVYNRLTDFYLDDPMHAALRCAYESDAVVLTPHPRAHALYANKHNLVSLSSPAMLQTLAVDAETRALLRAGIPATQRVNPENAAQLWARRAGLFFKPASGYGSKAAYRGDKLTRRVWSEIVAGDYVAQALVAPGKRLVAATGGVAELKFDLRAYAVAGKILLYAARIYQGQTTNFRTPGGGFAPVFVLDDAALVAHAPALQVR